MSARRRSCTLAKDYPGLAANTVGQSFSCEQKEKKRARTGAILPRVHVIYVYLTRGLMESHGYQRKEWDRIFLVVDMHQLTIQLLVNKVRKVLIPDTRHRIRDHLHRHALGQVQAEEEAI